MSTYELLLFLHIAAATIWLGAGFTLMLLVLGAERAGDHGKAGGYHRDTGWLAPRLFIPAALSSLVLGILLVIDGSWDLDQLWIVIGLVGWLISFGLGFLYFKPEGERIGQLVAERGPADAEAAWRIRRLDATDRVQLLILFLVLAAMVLKPTGDDTGVLIGGAAILAAAIAIAVASASRGGHGAGQPAAGESPPAPGPPSAG
jgi:uncharacterized membrane protein